MINWIIHMIFPKFQGSYWLSVWGRSLCLCMRTGLFLGGRFIYTVNIDQLWFSLLNQSQIAHEELSLKALPSAWISKNTNQALFLQTLVSLTFFVHSICQGGLYVGHCSLLFYTTALNGLLKPYFLCDNTPSHCVLLHCGNSK